jgi:hypothetical protein
MQEFVILTKLEELDAYSHNALIQFPKHEKFVLCAAVRQTLSDIIKLVIRVGKPTHILPRKRIMKRVRKSLKRMATLCSAGLLSVVDFRERLMSFLGYTKHCSNWMSVENILQESKIRRREKCR